MPDAPNIVILTGAGISAESGIPTFRASDGLWHEHKIEDVASPQGFERDPALVHRFYNMRREHLLSTDIQPNAAHAALAKLQQSHTKNVTLITQNIDDLHERAGFENVIHMHGELLKQRCTQCNAVSAILEDLSIESMCGQCSASGSLRPHIVWFGEMPMYMEIIEQALVNADVFVSIGTSGNVYPAAGFYQLASQAGAETIEMNLEATGSPFDQLLVGKASEVVPKWVDAIRNTSTT